MTQIAFAPRSGADASQFEVVHVTDGPHREWDVDVAALVDAGPIVLDTDTDGPVIAALDNVDGLKRVDASELYRTLPATLDEMNKDQLLATPEGHAVEGGADLSQSRLRAEMAKIRKEGDAS